MAKYHEFIHHVLKDEKAPAKAPHGFDWHHIMDALREIAADHSPESEKGLRAILEFDGKVSLSPNSATSHAMAPEDMMRSIAIQSLAQWDKKKHRAAIARVSKKTSSHFLAAIAK